MDQTGQKRFSHPQGLTSSFSRRGVVADEPRRTYVLLMQERIFGPASMDGARIGEEPRPSSGGYAIGWIEYTYTGGRRLIWHTGFGDGFGLVQGCFPEDDLGLFVSANKSVESMNYFHHNVRNLLVNGYFGLM